MRGLTAAYLRATWAAAGAGVVALTVWAISAGADVAIWNLVTPMVMGGAVGVATGLLVALASRLAVVGGWGRTWRILLAFALAAAVALLASLVLARGTLAAFGYFLAPALAAAVAQVVIAELSAARARGDEDAGDRDLATVLWSLAGGIAGALFAPVVVSLLRDELRFGCAWAAAGEGAGWSCGDGIGYVLPVAGLAGMALLVAAAGATLAARQRPRSSDPVLLAALAVVPLAWAGVWTLASVTVLARAFPPDLDPVAVWARLVLPALVIALLGVAVVVGAGSFPSPWSAVGRVLGAVLVLVACVLQPGLLVAILPAAGLAVAAATRRGFVRAVVRPRALAVG